MRVLLAHSFYRIPGGEDRYVRQQADLLSKEHSVHLLEDSNIELQSELRTSFIFTTRTPRSDRRVISPRAA